MTIKLVEKDLTNNDRPLDPLWDIVSKEAQGHVDIYRAGMEHKPFRSKEMEYKTFGIVEDSEETDKK